TPVRWHRFFRADATARVARDVDRVVRVRRAAARADRTADDLPHRRAGGRRHVPGFGAVRADGVARTAPVLDRHGLHRGRGVRAGGDLSQYRASRTTRSTKRSFSVVVSFS